jgi:uncharacterized protein (TIGR03437 family)
MSMTRAIFPISIDRAITAVLWLCLAPALISRANGAVTSVVKVVAAPDPVVLGQTITVAASVSWTTTASPAGTITVSDTFTCPGTSVAATVSLGTITLGSATSTNPGAGLLSTSSLACAGTHSLVAIYSGDSSYAPGTSQPLALNVLTAFAATNTLVKSSSNPATVGETLTLTAQVQYSLTNNTFPTGTVVFIDRNTGNRLGAATVTTAGNGVGQVPQSFASVTTTSLAAGSYAVQGVYSGDNIYSASTSDPVSLVLNGVGAPLLPAVKKGGVATAADFGRSTAIAPGTWIEIAGSNLASRTRTWTQSDFAGSNAPTMLDGTRVTIGGQPAFISYISPAQVNVQVPSTLGTGTQTLIVTTAAGPSAPLEITVTPLQAGLLAPQAFRIGELQYVAALFPDGAYVLPSGAVPGVASRPARPGETITLYGIGFGPVVPEIPAGTIVQQNNTLLNPVQFVFDAAAADVTYAGLVSGAVGLYQFNVVVPPVASSDTIPLTFTLAGTRGGQQLYLSVRN